MAKFDPSDGCDDEFIRAERELADRHVFVMTHKLAISTWVSAVAASPALAQAAVVAAQARRSDFAPPPVDAIAEQVFRLGVALTRRQIELDRLQVDSDPVTF